MFEDATATGRAFLTPIPFLLSLTPPHSFTFTEFFWALKQFGYKIEFTEYLRWRSSLMKLTLASRDNALYPLLHFVLDDLPTRSQTPVLDW